MGIVTSEITHNQDRGNGTRAVYEKHTDHTGRVWERRYQCALDHDTGAALSAHATKLNETVIEETIAYEVQNSVCCGDGVPAYASEYLTQQEINAEVAKAEAVLQAEVDRLNGILGV